MKFILTVENKDTQKKDNQQKKQQKENCIPPYNDLAPPTSQLIKHFFKTNSSFLTQKIPKHKLNIENVLKRILSFGMQKLVRNFLKNF